MSHLPGMVKPDSVRFLYGIMVPLLTRLDFLSTLSKILIPVTAQFRLYLELAAHVLCVLPEQEPMHVPDEIAFIRGAVDMSIDAKQDGIYESIEIGGGDCINLLFDRREDINRNGRRYEL